MKTTIVVTITVLALCFSIPNLFSVEEKSKEQMMQDEMMKKWQEFATPGEPHKMMANLVGAWNMVVKSYNDPSAPPAESPGTATFTSIMEGRYIQETAEGSFMGMPFHGMGVHGYDNLMKKYVSVWVDNMGTGIMTSVGTSTDGGKTINMTGKSSDPMSGMEQTYRSVMQKVSDDEFRFEMYGPGMDGKEMKMMEITYTRKK